jgi:hypothetical protein
MHDFEILECKESRLIDTQHLRRLCLKFKLKICIKQGLLDSIKRRGVMSKIYDKWCADCKAREDAGLPWYPLLKDMEDVRRGLEHCRLIVEEWAEEVQQRRSYESKV